MQTREQRPLGTTGCLRRRLRRRAWPAVACARSRAAFAYEGRLPLWLYPELVTPEFYKLGARRQRIHTGVNALDDQTTLIAPQTGLHGTVAATFVSGFYSLESNTGERVPLGALRLLDLGYLSQGRGTPQRSSLSLSARASTSPACSTTSSTRPALASASATATSSPTQSTTSCAPSPAPQSARSQCSTPARPISPSTRAA